MRNLGRIHSCALQIALPTLISLPILAACGNKTDKPAPAPAPEPESPPDQPTPVAQPDFPEGTRSLELTRTVPVRLDPGEDGKRIGTIAIDTRVGWSRTAKAKGCAKVWVEMRPRGWVCSEFVKPSKLPPLGREVPQLERGEVVPGTYGRVSASAGAQGAVLYKLEKPDDKKKKPKDTKKKGGPVTSPSQLEDTAATALSEAKMVEGDPILGTLTVRKYDEITVGGKLYWRTSAKGNEYILKSLINVMRPSDFKGTRLSDDTGWKLPIAFVWPRNNWTQAWTYAKPNAISYRQINARTPVPILETFTNKAGKAAAYRIAEPTPQAPLGEWIQANDVRVYAPTDPPPLLLPNERWIDVDLDNQILVAFEGTTPVYATMISSGAKDTPTTTGSYRIWLKQSEADMKDLKAEDPYSVATVPWTEFFYSEDDLALHTAYWHDAFGKTRSHGCVNLAPRDARWLYYWSDPQVSPGWTAASGVVEAPGSIVRVRSAADPQPKWLGYAIKVAEARKHRNAE